MLVWPHSSDLRFCMMRELFLAVLNFIAQASFAKSYGQMRDSTEKFIVWTEIINGAPNTQYDAQVCGEIPLFS